MNTSTECIRQALLRQYPLFNEIIDGCLVLEPLVDTLCVVKDKVVGKLLVKQFLVMDQIKVVIDKLLLEGSIVALNIGIDLRTVRIGKQMNNPISLQCGIEAPQVLASIIRLPGLDLSGINRLKPFVEILHVSTRELPEVERKRKPGFDLHRTVKVVPDPIGEPLHGVRQNVTEFRRLRRPLDLDPFLSLWVPGPVRGRIMINPACLLEKELMAFNDIADGGHRDQGETLLPAAFIQQWFNLLFSQAGVIFTEFSEISDELERDGGASEPSGTGGVRDQGREFPIPLSQSLPPLADELSIGTEGLLRGRFSIGLVELHHLHPLLRNLTLAKASEAKEHTL